MTTEPAEPRRAPPEKTHEQRVAEEVSFNLEIERSLLGALMVCGQRGPEAFDKVQDVLLPEHFAEGLHKAVYEIFQRVVADGRPLTPATVNSYFSEAQFDLPNGMRLAQYMVRLACEATTIINVRPYAMQIADHARRRKLATIAETYRAKMADPLDNESAGHLVRRMQAEIDAASSDRLAGAGLKRVGIGAAAGAAVTGVRKLLSGEAQPSGIALGIRRLDWMLNGGLQKQKLVIVAGRPGMGKTTVGITMALAAARQKQGVYVVSLEMGAEELSRRALSCMAYTGRGRPLSYDRITQGRDITPEELDRLGDAQRALDGLPIAIEQEPGINMAQIATRAELCRRQFEREGVPLGVIVVDHLGLIRADDRYKGNRVQEVSELTASLKNLSRSLDCCVIALCQLNRAAETRENKRPQLSDLRDSGSIEQDADVIMGLYREAYYLRREAEAGNPDAIARLPEVELQIEIEVLKQRNGETGRVVAFCDIGSNVITGLKE